MIEIQIDDLHKSFNQGAVAALKGVTCRFRAGGLHGIIGPAGAGKTTLLRLMLKLLNPDRGTVCYCKNGTKMDFEEIMPQVAYMPEQQSLYADLSIQEHLDFFAEMYSLDPKNYQEKRAQLLKMTRLGKFLDRPAGKLSGGMYKKLGLMCALLRSPQVILLDEPTNGVDPISRREFWEMLHEAVKNQVTVIMTTAYMDEAERCEEVYLMEDGCLLGNGEPAQLLRDEMVNNFDEFFIKRAQREVKNG